MRRILHNNKNTRTVVNPSIPLRRAHASMLNPCFVLKSSLVQRSSMQRASPCSTKESYASNPSTMDWVVHCVKKRMGPKIRDTQNTQHIFIVQRRLSPQKPQMKQKLNNVADDCPLIRGTGVYAGWCAGLLAIRHRQSRNLRLLKCRKKV
jgi:hypothetical protein